MLAIIGNKQNKPTSFDIDAYKFNAALTFSVIVVRALITYSLGGKGVSSVLQVNSLGDINKLAIR